LIYSNRRYVVTTKNLECIKLNLDYIKLSLQYINIMKDISVF